jgi:hypothetical protein
MTRPERHRRERFEALFERCHPQVRAILVASDGTVRSAPVAGHVAIESLIRLALQGETRPALAGR